MRALEQGFNFEEADNCVKKIRLISIELMSVKILNKYALINKVFPWASVEKCLMVSQGFTQEERKVTREALGDLISIEITAYTAGLNI